MSSDKYCCIPGCKESGGMHKVLHQFPNPEKERELFNTWLYAVGGDIISLKNEHIFKYRRICRRHFEEKYLCRNNRISKTSVPTLNMPDPLILHKFAVKRKPLQNIQVMKYPTIQDYKLNLNLTSSNLVAVEDKTQKENIAPVVTKNTFRDLATTSKMSFYEAPIMDKDVQEIVSDKEATKLIIRKKKKRPFLTMREVELHKKIVAAKVQISKYKHKTKRQAIEIRAAKKLVGNPSILNSIENCSAAAKTFIQLQWRENSKKGKGRRFTLNEKIVALSIFKQSPKGYRFLRKIFILPSAQTLIKLIQNADLQPGINKNIFQQLRQNIQFMTKPEKKLCILLFDEISLKANIAYKARKNRVVGFIDNGQLRLADYANHAQVFMVRGLIFNYKQPVAYTFSANATKGHELAKQIKHVVTELQQAGLKVMASVCDQSTNNRQAIKLLINETRGIYLRRGETPKDNVIIINNEELIPLYDPPHLLKGIRNNLMIKDLKYTIKGRTKIAKWSHLQYLYAENPIYEGIRLIPKLTENHVITDKINKMKVKYATQVFSRTVASNMGYLADKGILPNICKETADFILFMDNLFDSVNGSFTRKGSGKPLLKAVTPLSCHHQTWTEAKLIFKTMKFVNLNGKEECVPSINNWVWTLEGIEILLKKIKEEFNITSIWMRHLNQDPLENFFGAIRSHGWRNNNPTCEQFESAFTTLLINNLNSVHTQGNNCENDFCDMLHALIVTENCKATSTEHFDISKILNISLMSIDEQKKCINISASLEYISGYFLKKLKTHIFKNCVTCNTTLISENTGEYIKYREYAGRRWLCSPSNNFKNLIFEIKHIIYEILKENLEKNLLNEIIKTALLTLVDFNAFVCNKHKDKIIDNLIKIITKFIIFTYCKNINKILAGRAPIYDDKDIFQKKAKIMFQKNCRKRNKNTT